MHKHLQSSCIRVFVRAAAAFGINGYWPCQYAFWGSAISPYRLNTRRPTFGACRIYWVQMCKSHVSDNSQRQLPIQMPYILISQNQIQAIQAQLEFVTGQDFRFWILQNDAAALLCAWQNETHVDYLLHVIAHSDQSYQIAFAVQRYREIITRFDRRLDKMQALRLFSDPRQCVCYMTGQILMA